MARSSDTGNTKGPDAQNQVADKMLSDFSDHDPANACSSPSKPRSCASSRSSRTKTRSRSPRLRRPVSHASTLTAAPKERAPQLRAAGGMIRQMASVESVR